MKRIAIVGGGFSGLSAALRIAERADVTLFEATDRLGGVVHTSQHDGFLVEHGADMFTTRDPQALDLCRRIGFENELCDTNEQHRRAFVVCRGKLVPVPDGFTLMRPTKVWPFLSSPILSWSAKLRVVSEVFVAKRTTRDDESLADFARRRLGGEAYQRLVQPLIGGIFTADPEHLSMQAALPQFVQMERRYGSLIRGSLWSESPSRRESGARYGSFRAPRHGMGSLIQAIARQLPNGAVRLQSPVQCIRRNPDTTWELSVDGIAESFDGLIVALPAKAAAQLLSAEVPVAAESLRQIPYASVAVVCLGYRREQIPHPLDGFGCVAPLCEGRRVLSISFSSVKFAGRAPDGKVLVRAFIGGACQPELLDLTDDELLQVAEEEMCHLTGADGRAEFSRIIHWQEAMPQYHLGHGELVRQVRAALAQVPRLVLAGNAFDGVGIPHCIRQGEAAADELLAELGDG